MNHTNCNIIFLRASLLGPQRRRLHFVAKQMHIYIPSTLVHNVKNDESENVKSKWAKPNVYECYDPFLRITILPLVAVFSCSYAAFMFPFS